MLAYAALAGLDGGVLAWLFWTTRSAQGGIQRTIGTLMIVVDLVGIAGAVLGDTMLVADAGNQEIVGMVAIWIVPLIIVANITATVIAHIFDPAQAIRDAERSVQDELQRQKAEFMRANAATIAAQVAEEAGIHAAGQMVAGFRATFGNNGNGNGRGAPQVFSSDGGAGATLPKRNHHKKPPTTI